MKRQKILCTCTESKHICTVNVWRLDQPIVTSFFAINFDECETFSCFLSLFKAKLILWLFKKIIIKKHQKVEFKKINNKYN